MRSLQIKSNRTGINPEECDTPSSLGAINHHKDSSCIRGICITDTSTSTVVFLYPSIYTFT